MATSSQATSCRSLASCLLSVAVVFSATNMAFARIKPPQIDELVGSADLIVLCKVTSVQATSAVIRQRIIVWAIVGCAVPAVGFLLCRRKWFDAASTAVFCLVLGCLVDVRFGTDRKVACIQVSSTIRGTPPSDSVLVYYANGYMCDITCFVEGREYLLFLKASPSGYRLSWYHWGQWVIEGGAVQTELGIWGTTPSVPLAEVLKKIEQVGK